MQYFVFYKPYGILSQFSGEGENLSLICNFEKDIYPVGRLDKDSEGLVILTNDNYLKHRLTEPKFAHKKTYYVQVEGIPDAKALESLQNGVEIKLPNKKLYQTQGCSARLLSNEPILPERVPPIRYRANIPESWVELTLTEGKNRQVRKMTAAIGHPTLRLVRYAIEHLTIEGMEVGEIQTFDRKTLYSLVKLS